jgi:GDP-L-fucose synthase
MKKILVTGGSGFLGIAVVNKLIQHGFRQKDITTPRSFLYDFRKREVCAEVVEGQDIVIHLAANAGGIGWNQAHPGALFYDNAIMGINLMDEACKAGVKKFVSIGTVCSYPAEPPHIPFREEELWAGYPALVTAPYGMAKKALLTMGRAYREEYGFNAIYLIPVNLYGPNDHFFAVEKSHVVPALIKKIVEARNADEPEVIVWGSGLHEGVPVSREFLYVDDAAEAIVLAAKQYNGAEPINIGSGKEVPINDLVTMICEIAGYRGKIVRDLTKPSGQPRRCLDISKAYDNFGFYAKTPLEEGLRKTITWFEYYRSIKGQK